MYLHTCAVLTHLSAHACSFFKRDFHCSIYIIVLSPVRSFYTLSINRLIILPPSRRVIGVFSCSGFRSNEWCPVPYRLTSMTTSPGLGRRAADPTTYRTVSPVVTVFPVVRCLSSRQPAFPDSQLTFKNKHTVQQHCSMSSSSAGTRRSSLFRGLLQYSSLRAAPAALKWRAPPDDIVQNRQLFDGFFVHIQNDALSAASCTDVSVLLNCGVDVDADRKNEKADLATKPRHPTSMARR